MTQELAQILRDYRPNDFCFVVNFSPLTFDGPIRLVCKIGASDSSKMLLRAAYKFGHLVKL